jgi:outer membrane protein OmpA-like peptidoglycan-associated protein
VRVAAPEVPQAPPPAPTGVPQITTAAPPPAKAPVAPVQSAPLTPPESTAPPAAAQLAPLAPPGTTAQPPAVEAAAPPPLPTTPPPAPSLPRAAAAVPAPAPAAAVAEAGNTISVSFGNGSATLPPDAADTLKHLAARRGNGVIAVTGYGDAASSDPDAQSAALTLGLSRAQAIAGVLTSAGVPAAAVQMDAAAIGRGGTARLVQ